MIVRHRRAALLPAPGRLRPRRALGTVSLVAVLAVSGVSCAKPKPPDAAAVSTTSSSVPGGGVPGGASVPVTTAVVPTTARPAVCLASDTWGYAIIKATDPSQRGDLTPVQLTANLTTYGDAIKALVPANGPDIDLRTLTARKVLDGTVLTEAEKQAEKDAATRLDAWYKVTCPA